MVKIERMFDSLKGFFLYMIQEKYHVFIISTYLFSKLRKCLLSQLMTGVFSAEIDAITLPGVLAGSFTHYIKNSPFNPHNQRNYPIPPNHK